MRIKALIKALISDSEVRMRIKTVIEALIKVLIKALISDSGVRMRIKALILSSS
jgi:hypothetical protein